MTLSRKDALRRLEGLRPQVEKHVNKLLKATDGPDANHWRSEIVGWLDEMERLASFTGRKTAASWFEIIGHWRKRLGDDR